MRDNKLQAHARLNACAPMNFESALAAVFDAAEEIMVLKRHMRGAGNISEQGRYGVLQRLDHDKLARVGAIIEREHILEELNRLDIPQRIVVDVASFLKLTDSTAGTKGDAAFVDDLIDVINYAAILVMMTFYWWELPLESEEPPVLVAKAIHQATGHVVEEVTS